MAKFIVVLLTALSCSCIPESKEPLSSPVEAKIDSRLFGVWHSEVMLNSVYIHISTDKDACKKGLMDVIYVDHNQVGPAFALHFRGFVSTIGDVNYMNLQHCSADPSSEGLICEEYYFFAKYQVAQDGLLRVWLMSEQPVEKAIKAGKLKGQVKYQESDPGKSEEVIIEDSSLNIINLMSEFKLNTLSPFGQDGLFAPWGLSPYKQIHNGKASYDIIEKECQPQ